MNGSFAGGLAQGLQPALSALFEGLYRQQANAQQRQEDYEARLIQVLSAAEDPNLRTLAVAAQMEKADGKRGKKGVLSGLKLEDLVSGAYQKHPAFQQLAPVLAQLTSGEQARAPQSTAPPGTPPPTSAYDLEDEQADADSVMGRNPFMLGQERPQAPSTPLPARPEVAPTSTLDDTNAFLSVLTQNAQPPLPLAQFAGQPQLSPQVAQGSTPAPPEALPGAPPPGSAPSTSPVTEVEAMGFGRDALGGFGPMGRQAFSTTLTGRVNEKERFRAEEAAKRQAAAENSRRQAAIDKYTRDQEGRIAAIELKATHAMERVVKAGEMATERKKLSSGTTRPSGMTERDRQLKILQLGQDERDDALRLETERDKELRGIDRDRMIIDADRPALKAAAEQAWNAKISQTKKGYADAVGALQSMGLGGGAPSGGVGLNPPGSYVGELKVFPNGRQAWWDGRVWSPTPPGGGSGVLASPELPGAPPP